MEESGGGAYLLRGRRRDDLIYTRGGLHNPPGLSLVGGRAVSPSAAVLPLLRSFDARRRAGVPHTGVWIITATDARPSILFFTPVRVDGTCDFRPPWTGAGTAGC